MLRVRAAFVFHACAASALARCLVVIAMASIWTSEAAQDRVAGRSTRVERREVADHAEHLRAVEQVGLVDGRVAGRGRVVGSVEVGGVIELGHVDDVGELSQLFDVTPRASLRLSRASRVTQNQRAPARRTRRLNPALSAPNRSLIVPNSHLAWICRARYQSPTRTRPIARAETALMAKMGRRACRSRVRVATASLASSRRALPGCSPATAC